MNYNGNENGEGSTVMAEPRGNTDAQVVNDLIHGAVNDAAAAGVFTKLALCRNTRHMLWEGQTEDGLLPELNTLPKLRRVFTWAGAPDTGVPYADEVVVEQALLRKSAWNRGEVRLGPRELENADGVKDEEKAEAWQTALDFWLDVGRRNIGYQLGLFNVCVEEFGYCLLHVGARRVLRTVKLKVTQGEVLNAIVSQATQSFLAAEALRLGMAAEELELTDEAAAQIQLDAQDTLAVVLSRDGEGRLMELLLAVDPDMPRTEARLAARELRESGESATYYAPQDDGFQPFVEALVPFINGVHGTDLKGDGDAWWYAKGPVRLCEADVRVRAVAENWNEDFLEKVLLQANKFLIAEQTWTSRVPSWALSGAGVHQVVQPSDEKFYELIYVWREMPDGKGRPMVYHTLVHAGINDCVGFHECSGLERLPLHVEAREEVLFAVQSRGIPEIAVRAGMPTMKVLMDAEGARAQLGSNPPLDRGTEQHIPIEPGKQLFQKRGTGENKFMVVPGADQGAQVMLDRVRSQLDFRFFRHRETDADIKRLYREGVALSAAETIREVVRLLWKVMQGNVDTLRVGRLAGRAVNLDLTRDSMQGEVDVTVEFNVDGLSVESTDKIMEFGTKLIGLGADNVDVNELVNVMARMSNPGLARRIILSKDAAAEKIVTDQNNRISQMNAGVTMSYRERVTAPEIRLTEVMAPWFQDPMNMAKLEQDPVFGKKMQDEVTYLQRQIQQYRKNAVTGRTLMPVA